MGLTVLRADADSSSTAVAPRGFVELPEYVPVPLGFDTARRTLAEFAGNIATDAMCARAATWTDPGGQL